VKATTEGKKGGRKEQRKGEEGRLGRKTLSTAAKAMVMVAR
jgi:hypothetical protein